MGSDYQLRKDIDKVMRLVSALEEVVKETGASDLKELLSKYYDESDVDLIYQNLSNNLDTLETNLTTLRTNLIAFNGALLNFNEDTETLDTDLSELANNLTAMLSSITGLQGELNDFDGELDKLKITLTTFSEYLTNFNGTLQEFKDELEDNGVNIEELDQAIISMFDAIDETQTQVQVVDDKIGDEQTPNTVKYALNQTTTIATSAKGTAETLRDTTVPGIRADIGDMTDLSGTLVENINDTIDTIGDSSTEGTVKYDIVQARNVGIVAQGIATTANGTAETLRDTTVPGIRADIGTVVGDDLQTQIVGVNGITDLIQDTVNTLLKKPVVYNENYTNVYAPIVTGRSGDIFDYLNSEFTDMTDTYGYNAHEVEFITLYGSEGFKYYQKDNTVSVGWSICDESVISSIAQSTEKPVLLTCFNLSDCGLSNVNTEHSICDKLLELESGKYYSLRNPNIEGYNYTYLPVDEWEDNIFEQDELMQTTKLFMYVKSLILESAYPIGSIYMSVRDVDPEIIFGGEWVRISGKFLLGADSSLSQTANYFLGDTGGEATHTLTIDEMPSHHHAQNNKYSAGSEGTEGAYTYQANRTAVTVNTANTGGGQPHENMPPYLVVNIWKRTA